jgi:ABC-2 type transport system permease protein
MLYVMWKDLRLITRDRSALISLLLVPIVVIVVVAQTQSGGESKSIMLPVVNDDQGPVVNALLKVFRQHLDVREVDRATAERMVAVENTAAALLILPAGMSKRYLTEKPSTIELLTDPAQWSELQAIKVILLLAERDTASLGDPFSEDLIKMEERNLTGRRLEFSSLEQNIPGFSLMFVLLTLVFSVSFGLREEEVWGTSGRLVIAPVAPALVLGGKLLARLIIGTVQLLMLLFFGHVAYGLTLGHSPLALCLVAVVVVLSMACFSVIVAALARTREQIIPVGLSVVFLLAGIGGLWWPVFEEPQWMQAVAQGLMTTWSMRAVQDVMLRDRSLVEVAPTLLSLIASGVVSFGIGLRLFQYANSGSS